jgi:hypothetical protein
LTSITIPNGVTSIGANTFNNCTGLTSITIPDSVTNLGNQTFRGCTGLTSITIGTGVTRIDAAAFFGCKNVKTFTCNTITAPTVYSDTFGSSSSTYTGIDVTETKTLYVPSGATGYDASYWASVLLDSTKCNFVLSATL